MCLCVCLSVPSRNTHFRRSCRPLVEDRVPNIGLGWHNFQKKAGSNFFPKLLKIVKTAQVWTPLQNWGLSLALRSHDQIPASHWSCDLRANERPRFWRGVQNRAVLTIFNKFWKKIGPPFFLKIVSSQTNIRNAIFDQRSTRPPEVGVSRWHRHTHRHTHRRTWRLYDQLGPVGPSWWKFNLQHKFLLFLQGLFISKLDKF